MTHTAVQTYADEAPLDRDVIAQLFDPDGDLPYEFAISLLDSFVQESSSQVAMLQGAAEGGDIHRVMATAHRLRGGSATVGAKRMARLCAEIEDQLRRTPDLETVSGLVGTISGELQLVCDACAAERRSLEERSRS